MGHNHKIYEDNTDRQARQLTATTGQRNVASRAPLPWGHAERLRAVGVLPRTYLVEVVWK
jgi:hypothetical protein